MNVSHLIVRVIQNPVVDSAPAHQLLHLLPLGLVVVIHCSQCGWWQPLGCSCVSSRWAAEGSRHRPERSLCWGWWKPSVRPSLTVLSVRKSSSHLHVVWRGTKHWPQVQEQHLHECSSPPGVQGSGEEWRGWCPQWSSLAFRQTGRGWTWFEGFWDWDDGGSVEKLNPVRC